MLITKQLILTFFVCTFGSACSKPAQHGDSSLSKPASQSQLSNVVTNVSASGQHFYHLAHTLYKDDIKNIPIVSKAVFYGDGGLFEIELDQASFPVTAPNCNANIILRMPWSTPDNAKFIHEKYALYKRIVKLVEGNQSNPVDVIIELNPYVEKVAHGFELTQCNVFFRHAGGRYIDNT